MSVDSHHQDAFNKEQSCLTVQSSSLEIEPSSIQLPNYWDVDKPRLLQGQHPTSTGKVFSTPKNDSIKKRVVSPSSSPTIGSSNTTVTSGVVISPTGISPRPSLTRSHSSSSSGSLSPVFVGNVTQESIANSLSTTANVTPPPTPPLTKPGMFRSVSDPVKGNLLAPYKALQNWRTRSSVSSPSETINNAPSSPSEVTEPGTPERIAVQNDDQQQQGEQQLLSPRQKLMLSRSNGSRVLWSPQSVADATPESLRKALLNTRNNRSFNYGRPPKSPTPTTPPRQLTAVPNKNNNLSVSTGGSGGRPGTRSGKPPMSPMHWKSIPRGHKFIYQGRSKRNAAAAASPRVVEHHCGPAENVISTIGTPVVHNSKKHDTQDGSSPTRVTEVNRINNNNYNATTMVSAPKLDKEKISRLRRDHSRERQKRISNRRTCRSLSPCSSSSSSMLLSSETTHSNTDMATTAAQVMAVVSPTSLENIAVKKSAMSSMMRSPRSPSPNRSPLSSPRRNLSPGSTSSRSPRRYRHQSPTSRSPNRRSSSPHGNEQRQQRRRVPTASPRRSLGTTTSPSDLHWKRQLLVDRPEGKKPRSYSCTSIDDVEKCRVSINTLLCPDLG